MIYIAHRGLINGPDKTLENKPEHITKVWDMGFDIEIDLWVKDSILFLGHDSPQYEIKSHVLDKSGLWIHAKNFEALTWLSDTDYNYFWHQDDCYTLTSHKYIWTYPDNLLSPKSVCVLPEWSNKEFISEFTADCYAICSDYVGLMKKN